MHFIRQYFTGFQGKICKVPALLRRLDGKLIVRNSIRLASQQIFDGKQRAIGGKVQPKPVSLQQNFRRSACHAFTPRYFVARSCGGATMDILPVSRIGVKRRGEELLRYM